MLFYLLLTGICKYSNLLFMQEGEGTDSMITAFKQYKVYPDVISLPPKTLLMLHHRTTKAIMQPGSEFNTVFLNRPPRVSWPVTNENKYFTLMMVDPDVPSGTNPKYREFAHWLVVNIRKNDVKNGKTLMHYLKPTPPRGTGIHRYVFLVYEQPGKFDPLDIKAPRIRSNFSASRFAERYHLIGPYAGNFYLAQNENAN